MELSEVVNPDLVNIPIMADKGNGATDQNTTLCQHCKSSILLSQYYHATLFFGVFSAGVV